MVVVVAVVVVIAIMAEETVSFQGIVYAKDLVPACFPPVLFPLQPEEMHQAAAAEESVSLQGII